MTQLILRFEPDFLLLDEPWIDQLLDKEKYIPDGNGTDCLIYLSISRKLTRKILDCERFKKFVSDDKWKENDFNVTSIMRLC